MKFAYAFVTGLLVVASQVSSAQVFVQPRPVIVGPGFRPHHPHRPVVVAPPGSVIINRRPGIFRPGKTIVVTPQPYIVPSPW